MMPRRHRSDAQLANTSAKVDRASAMRASFTVQTRPRSRRPTSCRPDMPVIVGESGPCIAQNLPCAAANRPILPLAWRSLGRRTGTRAGIRSARAAENVWRTLSEPDKLHRKTGTRNRRIRFSVTGAEAGQSTWSCAEIGLGFSAGSTRSGRVGRRSRICSMRELGDVLRASAGSQLRFDDPCVVRRRMVCSRCRPQRHSRGLRHARHDDAPCRSLISRFPQPLDSGPSNWGSIASSPCGPPECRHGRRRFAAGGKADLMVRAVAVRLVLDLRSGTVWRERPAG